MCLLSKLKTGHGSLMKSENKYVNGVEYIKLLNVLIPRNNGKNSDHREIKLLHSLEKVNKTIILE